MTDDQLIPEWHSSEAIILAWPDEKTDWLDWLEPVRSTYITLITAINQARANIILLCRPDQIGIVKTYLSSELKVLLVVADYNDTWVRDYAFLTCHSVNGPRPVEFIFNGWGQKFAAEKDNLVNQKSLAQLCKNPLQSYPVVAEGGALEINDERVLLSTKSCLLNPKRNNTFSIADYQGIFEQSLGSKNLIALTHGHLQGDDTDGHIDTLVRFIPNKGLVLQGCDNRVNDDHFFALKEMGKACRTAFPDYNFFFLPLPFITNAQNERLPASYANYLVCNDTVLVPVYRVQEDTQALVTIQEAYPKHNIVGIDCSVLINQFGSLHCITMQVPTGTLKQDVISLFNQGVALYAS